MRVKSSIVRSGPQDAPFGGAKVSSKAEAVHKNYGYERWRCYERGWVKAKSLDVIKAKSTHYFEDA